MMLKRVLILCLQVLILAGCGPSCDDPFETQACTRVLFIGNSYTFVNDLPGTFEKLARSGGHPVETGMAAEGGYRLLDHVASSKTQEAIQSAEWTYIILQEQSEIPAMKSGRRDSMYPAARSLVKTIAASGAVPLFFVTWAHREGLPANRLDYDAMQHAVDRAYLGIAYELDAPVAPVGYAWFTALREDSRLELWQEDGSHPAEQGTYLAACVFYATIFRESPQGLSYGAGLSKEVAEELQKIAAGIVLEDASYWNLR